MFVPHPAKECSVHLIPGWTEWKYASLPWLFLHHTSAEPLCEEQRENGTRREDNTGGLGS